MTDDLARRVDEALAARARLARRPLRETAAALAAAAARWQADASLVPALAASASLSEPMVAAILPLAARALDPDAMRALVEREWGAGAAGRPAPAGPALVAHVLASNVPALALSALALGCLAGAAVLVKSGRDDPLSAPAFARALAAVDPDLASTVVPAYWPGGAPGPEEAALARADVVVATGGDEALVALRARVRGRFVAYGPRASVAAVGPGIRASVAERLALDVALHDQRGCLSPHAVYVEGDAAGFAEQLLAALDALALRLPLGPARVERRATVGLLRAEAGWEAGTTVLAGRAATVVVDPDVRFRPTCGLRTVRVHPLDGLAALPAALPVGGIECVGLAGADAAALLPALWERGVARVCPVGRMQDPPLAWPRGQKPPLGVLLGRRSPPLLEVES